jgi:hypothetical protein
LAIGEILIFIWMKFPLPNKIEFFTRLHECDLCSGVWIFFFLALLMRIDFLKLLGFDFYWPVASELITGGISSFVMWLVVAGWRSKFDVVVIR